MSGRLFDFALLILHALAVSAWLVLMPKGFSPGNPHFWVNLVLPIAAMLGFAAGLFAIVTRRDPVSRAVLLALGAAWLGASIAAWRIFPASTGWLTSVGATFGAAIAIAQRPRSKLAAIPALLGTLAGAAVPLGERAAAADTRPLNQAAPANAMPGRSVEVACGRLTLHVDPMLRFVSTSPDRCWTIFAPWGSLPGPVGSMTFEIDDRGITLTAFTSLDADVYSHLNHFAEVRITGHSDLRIAFLPAPGFVTPVEPMDYPVGRPTRFGYLDPDGVFHVVEATSAEKGPFHDLAHGPLGTADPLVLRLFDGQESQCEIAFDTWAAQVGLAPSPTAGWGVPVNAIEIGRAGEVKTATAVIWASLAATSVGRGWDSVGHRAGTYVNRIRVKPTR